ncbi:protein kinase [Streptomyces sp. NPDC001594]|uniref:serine/threonine-protein kinase n=1 Tax=Streptomyces sp. NPDC001594 TaxID=3364590 RepID=UPI003687FD07
MRTTVPGGRVQPAHPGDPKRIGPYRIIGRLGSGGMGTVHAALDPQGTRVAVKAVHQALAQNPEFRARFRREVALSSRVQGPCLVPLLTADPEAAAPWLATQYIPGPTLDQHLAAHGPLVSGSLYAFAAGTAQALAAIHRAGVVHRDVKPQNVILSPAGPRMLDFGIARASDGTSVTRTGVMTGTPGWISPEHYRSGASGPAGDVFAWGTLVAYAATGRLPFGAGAPDVVAFRVLSGEADLDGVPEALRETVEKALAKAPGDRPTAEDAAARCAALLAAGVTQVGLPDSPPTLTDPVQTQWTVPALEDPAWAAPPSRGRKRLLSSVALGAAVAGGLIGGLLALPATHGRQPGAAPSETGPGHTAAAAVGASTAPLPAGTAKPSAPTPGPADNAPTLATWRQARAAQTPAENDARPAMGTGAWLDPIAHPDQQFAVTFHQPRGEVYIASGGEELDGGTMREVARIACLGLRSLRTSYPDLPYSTYVIVDSARRAGPAVVWSDNFRTNSSCSASVTDRSTSPGAGQAGDWYPDSAGFDAAQIPSHDPDEIRIADRIATAIIRDWNGISDDRLNHDTLMVGFDPTRRVMYVWADKTGWNDATREDWARRAALRSCRELTGETTAHWPYFKYAVLMNSGEFLRWGSTGSCEA